MESSVERRFLGWDRPFLHSAADHLITCNVSDGVCDLQNTVVVVPVSRAGRRLTELLAQRAEKEALWLIPPEIVTTGLLPEILLGTAARPFASDLERVNGWISALQSRLDDVLPILLGSHQNVLKDPEQNCERALSQVAKQIAALHRELAGERLTFADVAKVCKEGDFDYYDARWDLLTELLVDYEAILEKHDVKDKDLERLHQLETKGHQCSKEIVLLATADLNNVTRSLIDSHLQHAKSLIFAPESECDGFDRYGCLIPSKWQERTCKINDDQIECALNPDVQALGIRSFIEQCAAGATADNITVGVTKEEFAPYIEQQLIGANVPCRRADGIPFSRTMLIKLLARTADYLARNTFADFAALVRHPDMLRYFERTLGQEPTSILAMLDTYQKEHLQGYMPTTLPGKGHNIDLVRELQSTVSQLFQSFTENASELAQWNQPIAELLKTIYGSRTYLESSPSDKEFIAILRSVNEYLSGIEELKISHKESFTAAEAIHLLITELGSTATTPLPTEPAVEILGWLELPLDDADVLCVAGVNETFVPESVNADLFLPNQLRKALGLLDNDQRHARDVYALSTLCHSKKELKLFFTKRNSAGDPLIPSRLLYLDDEETIVRRVKRFSADSDQLTYHLEAKSVLKAPLLPTQPKKLDSPIAAVSVTSFRDYIACPYRYYLKHVLKLKTVTDEVGEMDSLVYGTVLHDILSTFGQSQVAGSEQADEISSFLLETLKTYSKQRFGSQPLPAVRVQLEQMKARLRAFAEFQADWQSQGWTISQVEYTPGQSEEVFLEHEKGLTKLIGRIDRIDTHKDGSIVVFDYKTSEKALSPEKTHRYQEGWTDLQLPLYKYMLEKQSTTGEISVGYITLPRKSEETQALLAPWTEHDFAEAIQIASELAAEIYQQNFWPPSDFTGKLDDFAELLGTKQFGSEIEASGPPQGGFREI